MYNIRLERGDIMDYVGVRKARKYLIEAFDKYDFEEPIKLNVSGNILKEFNIIFLSCIIKLINYFIIYTNTT